MTTEPLPDRARVVVIGGGVIGTSVAYHLAHAGWTDVLLLEQGTLSCGTTWHAAGLVGPLRASESGTRLVQYSAELYARLEAETGLATGYRQVGGVIVARTEERMALLRRTAANAAAYDLDCALLTPDEAGERWPVIATDDLLGGIWLPGDGRVNPTDLTMSLAKGARQLGVRVAERVRVLGVDVADGPAGRHVTGVRTERGGEEHTVEAEVVVNCAGQWAKGLADQVGVTVPLHSAEHFYVVTEAVEGVHADLPILRDPDGWTYFKEEVGGLVVGCFEPDAKPWRSPDDLPHPFEFQLLDEDWDHFAPIMEEAVRRVPALAETGIRKLYDGPESFTPDNQFVLGEAPGPARLLRRRRVQLRRHRLGRWRRARAGRVDRRGRGADRPRRRRHPPLRAVPGRRRVAARARGRGARPALRDPVADPRARHRPQPAALRRCTTAWRRRAPSSAPRWAGSGPTPSPPRVSSPPRPARATRGASRRGCRGRRPSSAPPARRSRCSTRRRSASTSWTARTRSASCSGRARPTSTCRSARSSTRRCSTPAAPTSPT